MAQLAEDVEYFEGISVTGDALLLRPGLARIHDEEELLPAAGVTAVASSRTIGDLSSSGSDSVVELPVLLLLTTSSVFLCAILGVALLVSRNQLIHSLVASLATGSCLFCFAAVF